MIAAPVRFAVVAVLAVAAVDQALAQRGRIAVSQRDRRLAEGLAERAAQIAERGDRRGAARLLFRSTRWDPSLLERRRLGIRMIERVDRSAALNQAEQALRIDPQFGEDDPSLVARLQTEAAGRSRWGLAAALAKRRREIASRQPGLSDRRRARLDLEHGRLAWLAGDAGGASASFARFESTVAGSGLDEATALQANRVDWPTIVVCHTESGAFDRAQHAIERWEQAEGDSAAVSAARGRLALQTGEPLAAIEFAKQAIEAGGDYPTYELLISAFRAANQADRSLPELKRLADRRPDETALVQTLVGELASQGELDAALALSGEHLAYLLLQVGPVDPLAGADPQDDPTTARRLAIADAYSQRLRFAGRAGRLGEALADAPLVADRLGGLDWVEPALSDAVRSARGRASAEAWLAEARPALAAGEVAGGTVRAAATIASLVGRGDEAARLAKRRVLGALGDDESRLAAIDEATSAVNRLLRHGAATSGGRLAAAVLARVETGADAEIASAAAALHAAYANSVESQVEGDHAGSPLARVALRAYESAHELDPTVTEYAYRLAWLASNQGDRSRAIEVALGAIPRSAPQPASNDRPMADALRLLLAPLLIERNGSGDAARAIELYEEVLDHQPAEVAALNGLAFTFAERGEHLERALRMARRARQIEPDSPAIADTLGLVLLRLGQDDEAVAVLAAAVARLDEAADVGPEDERVVRARYAEALSRLGRAEEAESARRM